MGWIIIGDTSEYKDCLVCVCHLNKTEAEKVLDRMINNPTQNDLACIGKCTNLRLKNTKPEEEWWNDPFLAN